MKSKFTKYLLVTYGNILGMLLTCILLQVSASAQDDCTPPGGNQTGRYGQGGDTSGSWDDHSYKQWNVQVIRGGDPNELDGSLGFDVKKWVSIKDRMTYTIHFENSPAIATAPAQNVFIRMPVDPRININSLQLADVGFGPYRFTLPTGSNYFSDRLNVPDSLGLAVELTAGIDIVNKEIFWRFRSLDPATGLPPANAQAGFLPVNDTAGVRDDSLPGKGEGFVSFTLTPVASAHTGDTAGAQAAIIFDQENVIPTNSWMNTIDALPPTSTISKVGVVKDTVTLNWTGADDTNGSGIRDYALYYAENGGTFTLYQQNIAKNGTQFVGTPGKTYCFYTVASDNTGNQEGQKGTCEGMASIPLDGLPLPITWLYFKGQPSDNDAQLIWATTSELHTSYFDVERSLDGSSFVRIGTVAAAGNSSLTNNYGYLDVGALLLQVSRLYYRLKLVDLDGKEEYSIVVVLEPEKDRPEVSASPNPFDQQITLRIATVSASDQTDFVELYTMDGKQVFHRPILQRGSATILLDDLPKLAQGIYLLRVSVNRKLYTIRMVRM